MCISSVSSVFIFFLYIVQLCCSSHITIILSIAVSSILVQWIRFRSAIINKKSSSSYLFCGDMAQPAQQGALARPVIIPNSFSGEGEDWPLWLEKFNNAAVVNGYNDAERLRFLPARLEGTAYRVFQTVSAANPNAQYQAICTLLSQQFEPPQQQQLHEAEFRVRDKRMNETQVSYAATLRTLANRAFPGQNGPLLERMILQRFIDGQPSVEVRLQLASNRPNDLDEAIQRSVSISSAYQMEAMRSASTSPASTASVAAAMSLPPSGSQVVNKLPVSLDSTVAAISTSSSSMPRDEVVTLLRSIEAKLDKLSVSTLRDHADTQGSSSDLRRSYVPGSARGRGGASFGQTGRGRMCYSCGGFGHFASVCPSRNNSSAHSEN